MLLAISFAFITYLLFLLAFLLFYSVYNSRACSAINICSARTAIRTERWMHRVAPGRRCRAVGHWQQWWTQTAPRERKGLPLSGFDQASATSAVGSSLEVSGF